MKNSFLHYLRENHILASVCIITLAWFLIEIRGILIELFIAYIIMAALTPFIRVLERYKLPRGLATAITYIFAIAILITIIFPLVPFFTAQIQSLIKSFPFYIKNTANIIGIQLENVQLQSYASNGLGRIGESAFAITKNIFGGIFATVTVFVISVYLALDREHFIGWISNLFSKENKNGVLLVLKEIEEKLGAWVRGQIVLSFAIGILTWIVLTLLHIPFALPLAMIAGVLEIVPTLGPIISAIPAMIVALSISPTLMVVVAVAYFCIQFLENNLLVPKIMQAAVGINPIIIIISVGIGANMLGIAGALLAVPFLSALVILTRAFQNS